MVAMGRRRSSGAGSRAVYAAKAEMSWGAVIALGALQVLLVCWTRGLIIQVAVRIYRKLDHIMALVQIEQDTLDQLGDELGTVAEEVEALVADEDVPLPEASVEKITGALDRMKTALSEVTPVEEG